MNHFLHPSKLLETSSSDGHRLVIRVTSADVLGELDREEAIGEESAPKCEWMLQRSQAAYNP